MSSTVEEILWRLRQPEPVRPDRIGRSPAGPGTPIGLVVHSLALGPERRLILDVATGLGWLLEGADGLSEVPAASPLIRLAMLEWTWRHMPVPTASPLWQLEAAALALATGEDSLWPIIADRLMTALMALRIRRNQLPADVAAALRALERRCARLPPRSSGSASYPLPMLAELPSLIARLRRDLRARSPMHANASYAGAIDADFAGCFEVEWDRVPTFRVDPREHAVLARVSTRTWSVSVPTQDTTQQRPSAIAVRLWARLVDDGSDTVVAETPLVSAGRRCDADGWLAGRAPDQWHVEVSDRAGDRPRSAAEHRGAVARQSVFRAQLLGRFADRGRGLDEWALVLRNRAARKLGCYQELQPALGVVAAPTDCGPPFLAEELLDPARVALFLSRP